MAGGTIKGYNWGDATGPAEHGADLSDGDLLSGLAQSLIHAINPLMGNEIEYSCDVETGTLSEDACEGLFQTAAITYFTKTPVVYLTLVPNQYLNMQSLYTDEPTYFARHESDLITEGWMHALSHQDNGDARWQIIILYCLWPMLLYRGLSKLS